MHTLALFDLDNTLADTSIRDSLSYEAFFSPKVMRSLPPIRDVMLIAQELSRKEGVVLAFATGREERLREATQQWLDEHQLPGRLYMRPDGVHASKIPEIKRHALRTELLEHKPPKGYNPETDEIISMVLAWEDDAVNLTAFRTELATTGLSYVLNHVAETADGWTIAPMFQHHKRKKEKPKLVEQKDIEYTVTDQKGAEEFNKVELG